MPINEQEWVSIQEMVEREVGRIIGKRMDYFLMTKVNRNDISNNNIYVDELDLTPVPMFAFDYEVTYYDTQPSGSVTKKLAKVKVLTPGPEEFVLLAREMGSERLPRCLGVLQSTGFLIDEDESSD